MTSDLRAIREKAIDVGERPSSLKIYRTLHRSLNRSLAPWVRLQGENIDVLNLDGPTILAPVHRSNLDSVLLALLSERRIRALGKESLFTVPVFGYLCAALGAIPVRRGEAASDAMKAAKGLLDAGESMIVFPEGGRSSGPQVGELFDGVAWLAARTGARVIPIGIAGTEHALGAGAKQLRRSNVAIVASEPMAAPIGADGKRASRADMADFTERLAKDLQAAQDRAEELAAAAKAQLSR